MQKGTLPILAAATSVDVAIEYLQSSHRPAMVTEIGGGYHLITAKALVGGLVDGIDSVGKVRPVEPLYFLGPHEMTRAGVPEGAVLGGLNPALERLLSSRGAHLGLLEVNKATATLISASEQTYMRFVQPGVSVCFCKIDRILAPNRTCPNNSAHLVSCVP